MLTAQQLYELITHKDYAGLSADGQHKKRAADLLYSLWDGYKDRQPESEHERTFARALDSMMQRALLTMNLVRNLPNPQEAFCSMPHVLENVDSIQKAYADLPEPIKAKAEIAELTGAIEEFTRREQIDSGRDSAEIEGQEVGKGQSDTLRSSRLQEETGSQAQEASEQNARKDEGPEQNANRLEERFNEEMAKLAALFLDEYETYHQYRENSVSRKNGKGENMSAEEAEENTREMERSEKRLKDDLATLMVMDTLQREGKLETALDRSTVKSKKEELMQAGKFGTFWTMIKRDRSSIDDLEFTFKSLASAQLGVQISSASQIVKERRESAAEAAAKDAPQNEVQEQEPKKVFEQSFRELAESVIRLYKTVKQFRDGKHPMQKDITIPAEEMEDLKETYYENFKANIATLVVMDKFRREGRYKEAIDPEQLEIRTDAVMKSTGVNMLMTALTGKTGTTTLVDTFKSIEGLGGLAELLDAVQHDIQQEQRRKIQQERIERLLGPAKQQEDRALTEADCPDRRLQAVLEKLQGEINPSGDGTEEPSIDEGRRAVLEIFALRDLAKTGDPAAPVSDEQIRARMQEIMLSKGNDEHALYRAVVKRAASKETIQLAADTIQAWEKDEQFSKKLKTAFHIQTQREKEEKKVDELLGPEEKPADQELQDTNLSPAHRSWDKLAQLQQAAKLSESGQKGMNIKESRRNILEFLAVRTLGKTDGITTSVSNDQVRTRMKEIMLAKDGSEYALYRDVINCIKSEEKCRLAVKTLRVQASEDSLRTDLQNAFGIRAKEAAAESRLKK